MSLVLQSYYDNGIHQTLNGRVDELSNVFGNYTSENYSEFEKNSRSYVENFSDKESMELMIIDPSGNITVTSTGFPPDQSMELEDYKIALEDPDGYGFGPATKTVRLLWLLPALYQTLTATVLVR